MTNNLTEPSNPFYGSIQKKIFHNSLLILSSRVLSVFANFIIVPYIIRNLGASGFGTWESVLAISSVSSVFLLSFSQTLLWHLSALISKNKQIEAKKWVYLGLISIFIQLIVLVPLFYVLTDTIVHYIDIPQEFIKNMRFMIPSVVGIVLIGGIHEVYGSLLSGLQKTGLVNLYKSLGIILGQVSSIFFINIGCGITSVLLGLLVNIIFANIVIYYLTIKNILNIKCKFSVPNFDKSVFKYFLLTLLGTITLIFRTHISKFILASLSSIESVGNYGISSRVSSLVFFAVTFIMPPTITAVSNLYARGDYVNIKIIYTNLLRFFSLFNCLVTLFLCLNIERLVFLWVGYYNYEIINFSLILIIGQSIAVHSTAVGVSVCNGMGEKKIEIIYIIINLITNIATLVPFIKIFGPIGAVISTSFSWSISGFIFVFIMHKNIDLPVLETKKSIISLGLAIIFILVVRSLTPCSDNNLDSKIVAIKYIFFNTLISIIFIAFVLYLIKYYPPINKVFYKSNKK